MDWSRIERELNVHTLSFTKDKLPLYSRPPPLAPSLEEYLSDAGFANNRGNAYVETRRLPSSVRISDDPDASLHRRSLVSLMSELGGVTEWVTRANRKIENIDQIVAMLTRNIEDMSKGYESLAITCRDLHNESKGTSRSLQNINREKNSSSSQIDSLIRRIEQVEEGLKFHDEEFTTKVYVEQAIDVVANQIKLASNKSAASANATTQQIDRLSQQIHRIEAKNHEDSLQILRIEADSRRAKDLLSADVKSVRESVNLFSNDMRDIRESIQKQSKDIEALYAAKNHDAVHHKLIERLEAQLKESMTANAALTRRVELLEKNKDELKHASSLELDSVKIIVSNHGERITSVENAITGLNEAVESSTRSLLTADRTTSERLDVLSCDLENTAQRLTENESAFRKGVSELSQRVGEMALRYSENQQVYYEELQNQLTNMHEDINRDLATRESASSEMSRKIVYIEDMLTSSEEAAKKHVKELQELDTAITNSKAVLTTTELKLDQLSQSVTAELATLNSALIADKQRIELLTASSNRTESKTNSLENAIEALRVDFAENTESLLAKVSEANLSFEAFKLRSDAQTETTVKSFEATNRRSERIESSVSSMRQAMDALQQELLSVSEILQAKDEEMLLKHAEQVEKDRRIESVHEEHKAAVSDLELKVLRLQEQALSTEELLVNNANVKQVTAQVGISRIDPVQLDQLALSTSAPIKLDAKTVVAEKLSSQLLAPVKDLSNSQNSSVESNIISSSDESQPNNDEAKETGSDANESDGEEFYGDEEDDEDIQTSGSQYTDFGDEDFDVDNALGTNRNDFSKSKHQALASSRTPPSISLINGSPKAPTLEALSSWSGSRGRPLLPSLSSSPPPPPQTQSNSDSISSALVKSALTEPKRRDQFPTKVITESSLEDSFENSFENSGIESSDSPKLPSTPVTTKMPSSSYLSEARHPGALNTTPQKFQSRTHASSSDGEAVEDFNNEEEDDYESDDVKEFSQENSPSPLHKKNSQKISETETKPLFPESAQCKFCMKRYSGGDLQKHLKVCELRTEDCPHGCGVKVLWSKMQQHASVCHLKPDSDFENEDFDDD